MEAFSLAELVLVAHCSELISTEKKTDNDEISSQISAQIFEFCDNELFPETTSLQNSEEVTSCSNYCYDHDNSSFHHQAPTTTSATSAAAAAATMSSIFEAQEDIIDHDISASIDFSSPTATTVPPPPPLPPQLLLGGGGPADFAVIPNIPLGVDPTAGGFAMQPYDDVGPAYPLPPMNPSSPSCAYHHLGPASLAPYLAAAAAADGSGLFPAGLLMPSDFQPQDLDFQPDFCSDSMQRVFNPGELQALGSESQQLIGGGGNSGSLASDISNMGDQTFKVGKLSVEQRKEKIHRYMKKRNERNFSKKIKYACRKTLADSRPRVRGRFAKNDDFGETPRAASSNHEDDDEEEVVVKEEDDMVDSSDIFAHISGVNSFKCNYPIQSWI